MSETDHARANELFPDYQDGAVSAQDKTFLEAHLTACQGCQLEWQKFQKMMAALSGLKQSAPPPPDLKQATAEKIHRRTRGLFFRKAAGRVGVPYEIIAVIILLFFGLAYLAIHSMWPVAEPLSSPLPVAPAPARPQANAPAAPDPADEEPKIRGRVVESYVLRLAAKDSEQTRRHIERVVLTASGTLSPWAESPAGLRADFELPQEKLLAFYKDLSASFTWTEEKTTARVEGAAPKARGTIILAGE